MSTSWIYDRLPTHLDTGKHQHVWAWSQFEGGCAVSYAYSAIPSGRPWAPGHQPAPTTAPEPMDKDDFKDLRQQISAICARLDRLEGAGKTEPAAEPAPGEWRNDRPPAGSDEADDGKVWCWYGARLGRSIREHLCTSYALGSRPWWSPGNQPAPTSPPKPQPEPAPTRWITDRVPEISNTDREGNVQVPPRDGGHYVCIVHYLGVYPGTPWAPVNATSDAPWDPTTLDHNGWIRSRLPTKRDASTDNGFVQIPTWPGPDTSGHFCQHYTFVTPGQPWAPWDSKPGPYQP